MDVNDMIQGLQKLYGLLVTNAPGTSIMPSDILDENARSVLKNLLDEATQKIFIANAIRNDRIDPPIKNMDNGFVPGNRRKRCRVCKKSTVKQQEFVEDTNAEDFAQDSVSSINFQSEKKDGTNSYLRNSDLEPGNVKAIIEKMESRKWTKNNAKLMPRPLPDVNSTNEEIFKDTWKKIYENPIFIPEEPSNDLKEKKINRKWYPSRRRDGVYLTTPLRQQKSKSITSGGSYSSSSYSASPARARIASDGTDRSTSINRGSTSTMSSEFPDEYDNNNANSYSSSYETQQSTTSSASETELSSSCSESRPMVSTSLERTRTVKKKSSKPAFNHKKGGGGTLKKLKDRFAIIFHQHHHHHHHHKESDQHKPKSFIPSREAEAYGRKAVHKMQKSGIHQKRDQSQLGGLMGAVFRHVRHSKRSKSQGVPKPNKKVKKRWTNLTKKAHIKLGVGKKKSRLKALPEIK